MPVSHTTVRVLAAGPLEFRGRIMLNGAPAGEEAWLCRCGGSGDKPWCDGSHRVGAVALSGDPPRRDGKDLPDQAAPVNLEPQPNGPLKATGPLVILNDAGEVTDRTMQVLLCRCGRSARQPYCDGSHKRAGFVAP